jgi:hypothetical protein
MISIKKKYSPINKKLEKHIFYKTTYNFLPFVKINEGQYKIIFHMTKSNDSSYVTKDVIDSVKNICIKNHIIYNSVNIKKNIDNIISLYKSNHDIYILSQLYLYPAITLLKNIFNKIYPDISKKNVKELFELDQNQLNQLNQQNFKHKLTQYDIDNISLAKEIDEYSIVDENLQLTEATKFEQVIATLLDKLNIKYKTQEELTLEQKKIYGQPISTPDFLLETPFLFDNMEIKWIDAKNFYGANVKFVYEKIKDQTKKYINNYGNGLIIFSHGYSDNLQNKFNDNIKFAHINEFIN